MQKKAVLILVDGMRPDAIAQCGNPYAMELYRNSVHTLNAQTVMPSVTLPCHMSLFHSVAPQRHGILSNTYVPQVRPVNGICEVLHQAKRTGAFFYNWEELRDLARPGSIAFSAFFSGRISGYEIANCSVTDAAIDCIQKNAPDFVFVYLGYTDAAGHGCGWMTDDYLNSVAQSFLCIEKIISALPDEYTVFVTADHGGHERSHGTEMPEDMTIPLLIHNAKLPAVELPETSILDIAPTIAHLLNVEPDDEWEGKILPLYYES